MRSRWLAGTAFFVFKDLLQNLLLQNLFAADLRGFSRINLSQLRIATEDQVTLTAECAEKGRRGRGEILIARGFLFGTGFRGGSTVYSLSSQLLHNSFCVSLYIRLCWGSEWDTVSYRPWQLLNTRSAVFRRM